MLSFLAAQAISNLVTNFVSFISSLQSSSWTFEASQLCGGGSETVWE